ncbi:MAG TPA: SusC/RagA family TonB-linked outer membrane protein [Gemmatimonadaceae bacterium]
MRAVPLRVLAALAFVGLLPASLAAQQGTTVSGVVTGAAGDPLPSVNVAIPSLSVGAVTNDAGKYSFVVPAAKASGTVTLTARRIGLQAKSVQITLGGASVTQNFVLEQAVSQLEGVVVTALGQTREKSQLGTAVQQVSSEQLNTTHDPNIMNQLAGKVSGVTITGAGTQGGSVNVRIRGFTSISGNNNPLYVVDGVPISNTGRGGSPSGGGLYDNRDFGSAISDINPEDVANISVLKGPNAAALYGSRAANGVVLITTKKGSRSTSSTTITASNTWDKPSILPSYQNLYGQGSGGVFDFVDGAGGGVQDFNDQSFGPRLDGRTTGCRWATQVVNGKTVDIVGTYDQNAPCRQFTFPEGGPWSPHPDNVESFFNTGQTRDGNIAFTGGTDKASARLSLGGENVDGIIPNSFLRKITGLANGSIDVSSKVTATGSVNYIRSTGQNRPGVGYNTGILEQFVWFGRQVDMNALRQHQFDANGNLFNWNYNFHNNPFWLQYQNPETDARDRTIVNGSVSYRPTSWLNATVRSGTDFYRYNIVQNFAAGNINMSDPNYAGAFSNLTDISNENNTEALLTATKAATSRLELNGTFGGNVRNQSFSTQAVSTSGISVPGIYNVSNAAITPTNSQDFSRRRVNSLYGSASFTWDNWWTVEATGRNDWSSTLPEGNNSYFYPSVNTSIVLTDAIPSLRGIGNLTYAKIRGAWAQVGADASPYQLRTTYSGQANKFGSLPMYTLGNTLANANLVPEKTLSTEGGVELGFGDNRVTIDASIYDKATSNQIINLVISPTSGFTNRAINAGKIENKGFEALLSVVPVRTTNTEWTSSFNYSMNRGKVVSLYPGLQTITLGGTWSATVEARQGEPYGVIRGYTIKKDSAGNWLLKNGLPQRGPLAVLGNTQPKWTGGWNNTVRYKSFTLNALVDMHIGGSIFSVTNMFGEYTGVLGNTTYGREVDWDNPGIVVKGIDQATGEANTTNVTSEEYFQSFFRLHERYVYDDTWTKLREVRLSYEVPVRIANKMFAQSASIALVGRNLATWTSVPNIDPEFGYSTGNYQGMEFAALPNPRSIGFSIRLTP